jgi:hypothetical protein
MFVLSIWLNIYWLVEIWPPIGKFVLDSSFVIFSLKEIYKKLIPKGPYVPSGQTGFEQRHLILIFIFFS